MMNRGDHAGLLLAPVNGVAPLDPKFTLVAM
jgi:hypothetical protein